MKRPAVSIVLLVGLASSSVFAGIVTFDPPNVTVERGKTAEFIVGLVAEQLPGFDAANVVVGSFDLDILSFDYKPVLAEVRLVLPVPRAVWGVSKRLVFWRLSKHPGGLLRRCRHIDGWNRRSPTGRVYADGGLQP